MNRERETTPNATATRRAFLGAASAAVVGLAGCVSRTTPRADPPEPTAVPPDLDTFPAATFRGDLQNRGFHPETTVPEAVQVEWSIPINRGDHTAAKSSVVPAPNDALIWPGDTGKVHSVSQDGQVLWTEETDVSPQERGIHGTPTVANGTVYVGAYDGAMYAFDLETGDRTWKRNLGDAIGSSPAYYDGVVYIAVEYIPPDGSVFGLNAATGEVVFRSTRPTDHPHSTIAIDLDAGKLVVGSNDGVLYGWEFPSGEPAWTFETGDAIKGPVATHDGGAFVGSWDGNVYRVDLETGTEDWAYETNGKVMSGPSVDVERGTVYVGSHDWRLYALDLETGERDWAFDACGMIIGCPTVTSETVLVGSYDDRLWAVDRTSGEAVWDVEVEGWVTATPLAVEDEVYVAERAPGGGTGDRPGRGYALGPESSHTVGHN